ncbi:tail fiber domain-containing protein [Paraburkholderia bryophila]|uniref:Peptidase S74 domain-containing protein n=1 Tax=Paraburkholderia bryophila TaxID=420952 RepID=A0A7Y9W471_9BURK|nr:tail fiber domain-containing protein [Paraburkholderia bryophila]NYH13425.1 hypothetical protein [Paraburkholderia bryophila]
MGNLQKTNLGVAPDGAGGDDSRTGFARNNANVDVLNSQAALTTYPTVITANQDLPAACVGKRVNINNVDSVGLPAVHDAGVDGFLVLRNVGTRSTGIWPGGGNPNAPQSAFMTLNPGESVALDTDGVNPWRVLFRGRSGGVDETINGNLAVAGSVSIGGAGGDLSVSGKVTGVNNPNLQLNGSGELGSLGWNLPGGTFSAQTDTSGGIGSFFTNISAMTNSSNGAGGPSMATGPGVNVTTAIDLAAYGLTSGSLSISVAAFNAAGGYIGNVAVQDIVKGAPMRRYPLTGVTPDKTASIGVFVNPVNATAVAFGIVFRRIKVEVGLHDSLYSQEATIAYLQSVLATAQAAITALQGAPVLTGRPTFAGKVPWDTGNLPNPATIDSAQTFTGIKGFIGTGITFNTAPVLVQNPSTNPASIGFANNTNGGTFRYNSLGNATFEMLNTVASGYIGLICSAVTQTSDKALKTDIVPIRQIMPLLRTKRIVNYRMKGAAIDGGGSGELHIGVLAQEWQDDFPELVIETAAEIDDDGDFIAHQYDERGVEVFGPNGKPKSRKALGFNYANAAAVALAGLLEVDAVITAMQERIANLELKLAAALARGAV